jgi:hypothetical protein
MDSADELLAFSCVAPSSCTAEPLTGWLWAGFIWTVLMLTVHVKGTSTTRGLKIQERPLYHSCKCFHVIFMWNAPLVIIMTHFILILLEQFHFCVYLIDPIFFFNRFLVSLAFSPWNCYFVWQLVMQWYEIVKNLILKYFGILNTENPRSTVFFSVGTAFHFGM